MVNLTLPWRDIDGYMDGLCRPVGAKSVFGVWFYKYVAPMALRKGIGLGRSGADSGRLMGMKGKVLV
jgi:hypothetical protein